MPRASRLAMTANFFVLLGCPFHAAAQDEGDVLVGRSLVGQLRIGPEGSGGYLPEENIDILPVATGGLFSGWSSNEPGFDHLVTDQPGLDFYTLQSGTQVRLELIQCDPAFKAITASFTVIDVPGERALLGNQNLHTHLTFLIDSDDPMFDPQKTLWRATYKLVDTGATAYAESAPFTFYFANVACERGDCNADGVKNGGDVSAFVGILLDPTSKSSAQRCSADTDRDGYATVDDVASFVQSLLQ